MRCAAWALGLASACAALQPPSSVPVCASAGCEEKKTFPVFWAGGPAPEWKAEPLGEVRVEASELANPGFGQPTRDQLLSALARKAKELGADALTGVVVEEIAPAHQPDELGSRTGVVAPPLGSARGVAVRQAVRP